MKRGRRSSPGSPMLSPGKTGMGRNGARNPALNAKMAQALQYLKQRNLAKGLALLEDVLKTEPNHPQALQIATSVYVQTRQFAKAVELLERIVRLAPHSPDAHNDLGLARYELKQYDLAIVSLKMAVELNPAHPNAATTLGICLFETGQLEEAITCYSSVLKTNPDNAVANANLGNALQGCGRYQDAVECYRKALRKLPDLPQILNNLGNALSMLGLHEEAVGYFRKVTDKVPNQAEAWQNLGNTRHLQKDYGAALEAYRRVWEISPDRPNSLGNYAFALARTNQWSELDPLLEQLALNVTSGKPVISPFKFMALSDDAQAQLACAKTHAKSKSRFATTTLMPPHTGSRKKLRIGYLSADFKPHAVSFQIAELFELHDRKKFEIHGFALNPDDGSEIRKRIANGLDALHDLSSLTPAAAARTIAEKGIDILVDLGGYTQNTRPEILALRPAPAQVNYLGFPGTMGADFVDYILADDFVIPENHSKFYSERVMRLPGVYMVNDDTRTVPEFKPSRAECGLPDDGFIFCCFNNSYKITGKVFKTWMNILGATGTSCLWLRDTDTLSKTSLQEEARRAGIEPDRILFAPRVDIDFHFARHRQADLFIDTFPYNAHTTAYDALRMGLPLLTCPGESFASRVAGSLAKRVGLEELIVGNFETYEEIAISLARQPGRIQELKNRLETVFPDSCLANSTGFCRNIENAFMAIAEEMKI